MCLRLFFSNICFLSHAGRQKRRICPQVLQVPGSSPWSTSWCWLTFLRVVSFDPCVCWRPVSSTELQSADPNHRGHGDHPERDQRPGGAGGTLSLDFIHSEQYRLHFCGVVTYNYKNSRGILLYLWSFHRLNKEYKSIIRGKYLKTREEVISRVLEPARCGLPSSVNTAYIYNMYLVCRDKTGWRCIIKI